MRDWYYNEVNHVGVDYSHETNAQIYDAQMAFRDYSGEVRAFLKKLNAPDSKQCTAIDLGSGTGAFPIHAAEYFDKVLAVDVSGEMLRIAQEKAEVNQVTNIEFCQSGFLQFSPPHPTDIVFSKWAFHHLPDFWKQAALLNINKMLKPGGVFYLFDVIFQFDVNYDTTVERMLQEMTNQFDNAFIEETKLHIREEFSTFDWILEGMLERAGFEIEHLDKQNCLATEYFCRKVS